MLLSSVPHLVERIETELYMKAVTLVAYLDHSTLFERLQQVALSIGNASIAKTIMTNAITLVYYCIFSISWLLHIVLLRSDD